MTTSAQTLAGRAAVVTGAGRGIGRATALALASRGAKLLVNDLGATLEGDYAGEHPAEDVAREIRSGGGEAIANADSVAEWGGARRIVDSALEAFGRIDFLVNNAGLSAGAPIWEIDPEVFDRVVRSHLHGTFHCMRAAAPHMKTRGFGRIVNLVSRAGLIGMPGTAAYGAGKGGIFGLTNAASRDLAAFGITVNAVNPAATGTRMVTTAIDAFSRQGDAEKRRAAGLRAALQPPEQVAALITALCHDGLPPRAIDPGATPVSDAPPSPPRFNGQVFFLEKDRVGLFHPLEVDQSAALAGGDSIDAFRGALAGFEPHDLGPVYDG